MKKLLPILCAQIGLLVGGVGAYLLFDESEPPRESHAAQDIPRTRRPQQLQPLPPKPGPEPAGDGEITGRVYFGNGAPLAGVAIFATPQLPRDAAAGVSEQLAAYADRRARERALMREANTDDSGSFRVTGLDPALLYAIKPQLEGYRFQQERGARRDYVRVGTGISFTAERAVTVTGVVTLPDGRPPDHVRIVLNPMGPGHAVYWHWTPLSRTYQLEPGDYTFTATSGRRGEFKVTDQPATVRADEPTLEIRLKASPGIAGHVIPAHGIQNMLEVHLLEPTNGKFPATPPGRHEPNARSETLWDIKGYSFAFLDLNPGVYRLMVAHGNSVVATRDITVTDGLEDGTIELPQPDRADFIVVRVIGPEGPLDKDVNVGLLFVIPNRGFGGHTVIYNRGNGEYWLSRDEHRFEGGEGHYKVSASSEKLGTREQEYQRTDTHTINFTFGDPAFVLIEVVGFAEYAHNDALRIAVYPTGEMPDSARGRDGGVQATRDKDNRGIIRYGPTDPGEYTLGVTVHDRDAFGVLTAERRAIHLRSGEQRIQVTPPQLYSVTVNVPEQYRTHALEIQHLQQTGYRKSAPRSGQAEIKFDHLLAGDYSLHTVQAGTMKISIPQMAGEVTFAPLPFNALLVDGNLEGEDFPLHPGDYVLEIDGTPLSDAQENQRLWAQAWAGDSTTFMVAREGRRFTVTFNPKALKKGRLRAHNARYD